MKKTVFVMILATVCCAFIIFNFVNVLADPPPGKGKNKHLYPIDIPQTGQINSYATGDDGDLQMGIAWPNPRFTDNSDGTVRDNLTGLIWLKNADCFGDENWYDALSDCNNLGDGQCELTDRSIAGDWRLPNVRELLSLVDYGSYCPPLPAGHPFIGTAPRPYWSSSIYENNDYAWAVNMCSGSADNPVNLGSDIHLQLQWYVWPVRGGND